ncbi:MAG TPA: protein-glutamate O-methyltransferase [Steroidobacteraceae bacterium]|jgi:chemotaxis protein methyltransferase CheR
MNRAANISEGEQGSAEFVLTDAEFARICVLVREQSGIALTEAKRQMVYGRLVRRLRALRMTDFADYVRLLERGDAVELQEFTNAITTNLTSFFREIHHFEYLAQELLPELAPRLRDRGRLRIWSSACSTGEEPYSIAMVLREQQELLGGVDTKILATDLDSNVLATASAGSYPADRVQQMDPKRVAQFFRGSTGVKPGQVQVSPLLQQLITFKQLNLMHEWPMRGPFEAIFCRNVVIYFDIETKRVLFERMARLQPPGAILFLGHSENLYRISERYELVGRTIYRRRGD